MMIPSWKAVKTRNSFALIEALFAMENSNVGHMTEQTNETVSKLHNCNVTYNVHTYRNLHLISLFGLFTTF